MISDKRNMTKETQQTKHHQQSMKHKKQNMIKMEGDRRKPNKQNPINDKWHAINEKQTTNK